MLGKVTEKTLYRELYEGLNDLHFLKKEIEIINEDKLMDSKLEIIECLQLFGVQIDREANFQRMFSLEK